MGTIAGFELAEETAGFVHEDKNLENDIQEIVNAYRSINDPEMRKSAKMMMLGIANGSTII